MDGNCVGYCKRLLRVSGKLIKVYDGRMIEDGRATMARRMVLYKPGEWVVMDEA
jgi:hypothetical protein